jgi:hypothetical protein
MVALTLKTTDHQADLLRLPWERPLAEWPDEDLVSLPAGNFRHVVRFLDLGGTFVALKELPDRLARREFEILGELREERLPAVTLIGIATDRAGPKGEPLEAVLITRHLSYSVPYRSLFGNPSQADQRHRLVDALAVLLVRLHLAGFYWGDCSLNNALFRRDAGALRAYLVDTETAERHEQLSDGQRRAELDIAAENVAGGLLDLEAEGRLEAAIDPAEIADQLVDRYGALWSELTDVEELAANELGRIHARLQRLNDLGFDIDEYELRAEDGLVRFRPTVVEEGHHKRLLERLTGVVAHENQARFLLSAMRGYGAWLSQTEGESLPEAVAAFRWLTDRWRPTLDLIPSDLRKRREDAELYREILEHNWTLSKRDGREVPIEAAAAHYVDRVLSHRSDERHLLPED